MSKLKEGILLHVYPANGRLNALFYFSRFSSLGYISNCFLMMPVIFKSKNLALKIRIERHNNGH